MTRHTTESSTHWEYFHHSSLGTPWVVLGKAGVHLGLIPTYHTGLFVNKAQVFSSPLVVIKTDKDVFVKGVFGLRDWQ